MIFMSGGDQIPVMMVCDDPLKGFFRFRPFLPSVFSTADPSSLTLGMTPFLSDSNYE
jgi:hypothetical protein